jgi:hypothetical protein
MEALRVFWTENGEFDLEGFAHCLKENGIEAPKVNSDKHGWRRWLFLLAEYLSRSAVNFISLRM